MTASGHRRSPIHLNLPELGGETTPPPSGDRVPLIVAAMVAATVAVGLTAKEFGVDWGAPAQPLFITFDPVFTSWLVLSLAGLAAGLYLGLRLYRSGAGPGRFGLALFGLALFTRLALNLARSGPEEWYSAYIVRPVSSGRLEYLGALTELKAGIGPFLDDFVSLVPTLPLHPAGHPPGLVVTLDFFGIETPEAMAALTIVVGAAATPALYALGRRLFDEKTARVASLLFVFVPTALLYGATSADSLFATLGLVAVLLMLSRRAGVVFLGAISLAIATFFSYALLAIAGWAGLVKWRRDGFASMLRLAALCAIVLVAFYAILAWTTGFDVTGAVEATHDRYYKGVAGIRPYLFYFFGSPAAFLIMLGPVAWFAARSLGSREITALALAAVILVAVIGGYTKAETERIWLFLVPLACLSAARALPGKHLKPMLIALAAQALLTEVFFDTTW
jgi:hypothetical protein